MRKMRIYEYAKEKNVASKDIIDQLKDSGVEVSNHMSVIDEKMMKVLEGDKANVKLQVLVTWKKLRMKKRKKFKKSSPPKKNDGNRNQASRPGQEQSQRRSNSSNRIVVKSSKNSAVESSNVKSHRNQNHYQKKLRLLNLNSC